MKAVIDTSVFVSALIAPRGAGAWLLALWRDKRFKVIISAALHEELVEVLERPEIASKVQIHRRLALMRRLRQDAVWTPGTLDVRGATGDPEDDKLVSAALEVNAAFIVTWDETLLEQESYQGVRFVTPDQFISAVVRAQSN